MSYVWTYKFKDSEGYERDVGIPINTLDDLLDLDNQFYRRHNKFGNWYKFFLDILKDVETKKVNKHPKRRLANEMAKQIALTFFEVLMEDLLENKVTYQFPYRFFASLGIREVDWKPIEDPTQLYYAEPCMIFTEGGRKRMNKTRYYVKLTERWRNRLAVLVDKGQRFNKFERYA